MSTINKHAYLIIAHGNPYVLEKLILLLDDERNDIYIHIDKKVKHFDFSHFQSLSQKSHLTFTERIDVRWGHVSLIEVELLLFKTAHRSAQAYSYYHLISGSDLPLQSQKSIHQFFENNSGKEFLGFSDDTFDNDRVSKIHLFPKYLRVEEHQYFQRLGRKLRNVFLALQRKMNYNRHSDFDGKLVFGTQWASLTHRFVGDLLLNERWFLDFYKYANCSDEIYKQTFAYNSDYRNAIYSLDDELNGCQRFMDWKRGRPYTFRNEDFDLIMHSGMLFARKFEDAVDKNIVDRIYNEIKAK